MSNLIIIDRKHKRKNFDTDWTDPFSLNEVHKEKARTIDIPNDSKNPAHQVMRDFGAKGLIGRKAFCFNDKKEMVIGFIVDVIPPHYLHLQNKGVFKIDDVVSIGG